MRFQRGFTGFSSLAALCTLLACTSLRGQSMLPNGFVSLPVTCPEILISADYATSDNFTGGVVDGYRARTAVFSAVGAEALCRIQKEASKQGLRLKIFDAYRPEKAVRFFQDWARQPEDDLARKRRHYPTCTRQQLFERGYIAERSSHSRGSAVDLTLARADGSELDMGTVFDYFHEKSHTMAVGLTPPQRRNRALLKRLMEGGGFKNYDKEWWHYSLLVEAFPGQSFDFDVE